MTETNELRIAVIGAGPAGVYSSDIFLRQLKKLGEGPYYAIIAEENNLCSWGGLLVNTDYQVLDDAKLPIKGLYAVGNEAGGNLYNDTYVGFGYGMANTITSGYLCGTKLGEALS